MEREAMDGLCNVSKAAILRVIVGEKLTTAAQEILAVVERTVADYEEEASGFRQEIDRQRRQLEVLLHSEIKVETTDDEQLFPIFEPTPEQVSGGGGQFHEEEQQHKIELSVEDDGSVGFLCYTGEHTGEEEQQQQEEEEESCERQALTPLQEQDHITEPDYEIASRLLPPTVQSDRRSIGKPRVSESQGQVDLRICILENSQIEVLSAKVFQQCPVQELQCPRGLEEADFLDLLRSTFPQLAADKPFDFFTTDRRRTLQPLRVKTLTPEEICGTIRSIGAGNSALYIRLKTEEEQRATDEEFHLPQRKEAAADSASDPTRPHPEYLNSSAAADETVQSDRRRRRRRSSKPRSNLDLRIRILEDSQTDVLSTPVFQQCPVQELQCPHGLEEADFLDLLRSTFPQLAADKPFDFFTTDRSRTLQPLRVKTLTPEEICETIRSIGAGNSALYIRLKTKEEQRATDEEFHLPQRKEAAADSASDPTRPHPEYLNSSAAADETVQSDRRRRRRRSSKPRSNLDLRIRILEDSQADVLSTPVFQQCPVQELQCPHGLEEADFLDLLKSTFPQLATDKPFDFFTTDRSRTLQPLRVKTLTPEEICETIRSIGAGNSALYIRLKTKEEQRATDEEFHLPQRKEAAADSPSDPTRPHPEYLNSSAAADETVQPERRRRRRRSSKPRSDLDLRIRILEDSQTDVLSTPVFQQCPVQELQCPHGLEEADFLDLLRSTFPQLAADKPFDFFTTDRSRTLQPLRVKTLTPEEICETIRSIGAGNSALYIRLKPHEKLQVKTNRPPLQRKDVPAKNSPSAPDHTGLNGSVGSDRKRLGRPRLSDILNHVDLRIRLLEDSQIKVLSARVFRKYPVQELRCPRGLQEADFLDLLRSTFPQLAADGLFDVLVADRTRMLQPLRVKTLTPEEVSSTMRFFGHSVLYIRLKAPEEKAHLPQGNVDAATDSPSTSDPSGRHSSSVQQQEGNRVDFLFSCSTSEQQGVFTEEADDDDDEDEDCERSRSPSLWSLQCLLLSESEQDEEEVNDGDDDWRPEKTEESLRNKEPEKTTGKRRLERPRVRAKRKRVRSPRPVLTGRNGDAPLSCSICGALRWSTGMLIKHSWSHVDHLERQCGVCGEQSESTEQLRIHLQSHQKTHSCNICGKSFLSTSGYNGHIALHKGEKPHKCKICHKAFTQRGTLVNHMWVHTANKPHKCDICQISCVSKTKLESHRVKHTGESLYSCSTCSKPFRSLQTLSQHMVSHSGRKRLYDCDVCGRKFTSNKRLQSHLRRHSSVPTAADSATNASGAKPSW